MSGQSARKKRIGSRRRVANQNKASEPDEFHIMDSASEAQIKEDESLNILADADNSQSETHNTPSSEFPETRRKLGSSRRRKGGQHVTDSATETYHKPGDDVEEETRGNENLRATQMSVEIQPQRQEQVSQGSEHNISATHDGSLYSAFTSDYSPEAQSYTTYCPEPDQESSIPKSENLRADGDEYGSDYKVSDESKDAHLVGASELPSLSVLSCPTVDQQLIDQSNSTKMPEELSNVDFLTEKESEERDRSTDLSEQDGNLQGNYWSESHVKSAVTQFSSAPEKTTDESSPREKNEFENSIEQATCSSPSMELPKDKEQNEHFNFQVKEAPHSEDPEHNLHDQEFKATQIHNIDSSSESVTRDATEKSGIISGNLIDQSEVSDTYRSELVVESADDSAAKQEDSNPDDRQDVHDVNENSLEALDHTNEDYHLYDTEAPQISGIERLDTAAGQVYQTDDHAEDEIKPSVEPTVHQEKEELSSEMQESDPSSQTLQSEIQDRLDSQPQLDATGFSPTRSRRKLGSSRRIKGRHHVKDSDVESHHRLTEEVAGNISDNEPLKTTNISLTIETTVQEKSVETMVEGMDTFVTTATEENAHVDTLIAISELTNSTIDQQLIDQSNSTEMPEEELPDSVTEKEEEDGNKDTDEPRQDGNLQDNYLVSESPFKSEDIESSITPETSKDKHNPSEHAQPECSVEQATVSLTKEELPTSEEQNTILSEVKEAPHSEDHENNLHDQEFKATQIHDIDSSSESVIRDATEKSGIISGNLIDQSEVSDTYRSELVVESADDSAAKQEDSNPDDRQDVHDVNENSLEALDHTNEDYHLYDTEAPQISGIERLDTAAGQVYRTDDHAEDEIKPSVEPTVHQEKEELSSEMQESDPSSQTLQSEIQDRLDSQPQLDATGFSPTRSRRKLGSSRRIKGRHHAKDSDVESHHRPTEEVAGNISDNEPLKTTNISLTIETTVQEKSVETMVEGMDTFVTTATEENAHVDTLIAISELTTSTIDQQLIDQSNSTEMPEEELPDSVTEKEEEDGNKDTDEPRQDGNLQDNYLVSESPFKSEDIESSITPETSKDKHNPSEHAQPECSVEQATVSLTKEELPTSEEQNTTFSEVKEAPHSEDPENNLHDQEFKATQIHDIDSSSESVIRDATEKSGIISGNLIDQSEVSDTYRSELVVESADDSAAKQEDSNPDDRQDVHAVNENSLEALDHTNEDYHLYDTEAPQISGVERLDTAAGQVYRTDDHAEDEIKPSVEPTVHQEKEELSSEMQESDPSSQTLQSEIQDCLDSQPQLDTTGFSPTRSRRKLGSSRRIKGRHHAKDSDVESHHRLTEEVAGNISDNEPLKTTNISLTIETTVQEKSVETMVEGMDTFVTTATEENAHVDTLIAISELTNSTIDQQLIDQSNSTEMPEEELPDSVTEKEEEDGNKDTDEPRQDRNLQDNYLVTELHVKSEDQSSITPEIVTEKDSPGKHDGIERSDEQTAFSSSKEKLPTKEEQKDHVNLSEGRGSLHSEGTVNEVHEEAVRQTQMQEMHEIDLSTAKESKSSLQTLQSEMNAPLDSQCQGNYVRIKEQTHTGVNPIGNRRKLGSSRRNKSQQQAKDCEAYHEPKEVGENTRGDESTVNDEENIEKPSEVDSNFSQNIMDNSEIVTIDIASGSHKDDSVKSNEEEKDPITEPENSWQTAGHDAVKMDLTPSPEDHSDIQNISCHRSVALDILDQEDTNQVQTTEAVQQAETEPSQEVTHAELFRAVHINADASAEDVPEEGGASTAVSAFNSQQWLQEESNSVNSENANVKRRKMGSTRRSQLNRKPKEGMDDKDETKESDLDVQAEIKHADNLDVVEELPISAEVSQNENAAPSSLVSNQQQETDESSSFHNGLQSIQSNMSAIDDLTALLPVKSASHNEEVVNPVPFVQVEDNIRNSERNVDLSIEPSQLGDFTGTEMHITSELAERNSCSIIPLLMNNEDVANTGNTGRSFVSLCETTQGAQNDEQRLERVNMIEDQALKSAAAAPAVAVVDLEIVTSEVRGGGGQEHKDVQAHMADKVDQGVHSKSLEMKNPSPDLISASRRRKMGSTRRNLVSRLNGEDLHQKQELDNEATETPASVGDVKTESFRGKDSDSEQIKAKVFETVEYSHAIESHFKPPSHQTLEETPASHDHLDETEHQLSPRDFPALASTPPKHDVMSEKASRGRRRKLGSHRKSRGHQSKETATTEREDGGDVRSIVEESAIKTAGGESLRLGRISEVDESDKKPSSSNISTSKAGAHPRPVSEETQEPPVQHLSAVIPLSPESPRTFSLAGSSRAAASRSNTYNVMMVGDSSVGKTSFMKRAQSGKFSLDIPASVGLDSCMWNVVVDGKSVVLHLWDTAGQERFHSITRQIFHKAQAFLLMYDITSSKSFSAVSYWANCIQEGAAEDVTILLLGNKSDHAERRIKTEEGESLAKEYKFEFMECSAATGENVVRSLETVARLLSQKADARGETTVLHKGPHQKKSSGCC